MDTITASAGSPSECSENWFSESDGKPTATSLWPNVGFGLACGLLGAAVVMFEQAAPWGTAGWGWHSLRLLAYGVVFGLLVVGGKRATQLTVTQEAREENERFRVLFEACTDALIVLQDGKIAECNPAACKLFDCGRTELRNLSLADLSPPIQVGGRDSHELAEAHIRAAVHHGSARFEWIHRRSDGTTFPADVLLTRVEANGREVLQGTVRDITESKQTQKHLELMEAAIEHANEAMFTIDASGRIVDVNRMACDRLEYSREELLSLSVWEINTHCSQNDWTKLWRELKTRRRMCRQSEHRTKGGELIPVEVSRSLVAFDNEEFVCDFARDITVRLKAESALQESEERFRQFGRHLQDILWMTSASGEEIIYVSDAYETIWGRSCDSLYAEPRSWCDGIHPDDRDRVTRSFFEKAALGGYDEQFRVVRPDGTICHVQAKGFPIRNDAGEVYRIAGVARDVTRQRRGEEELQKAKTAAETANEAKSRFLANMSHEIRTPLNSILGFTDVLRRGLAAEGERKTALETIHTSGRHLLTLVDDILDLSKVEAGEMEFERIPCSPHSIICEVLSTLRVRAQEKCLSLEAEWTSGVPETIHTDPARLRQLLMNVVGNAIKFTEQGGVKLTASVAPGDPEPRFSIEVRDTGIGIAPKRIDSIFNPFTQADNSILRRYGGTGLGLAICRHIVHGLGGDISVESEPGQGSTFRITLETGPLDGTSLLDEPPSEAFAPQHSADAQAEIDLSSSRILLVEDGESNRDLIRIVLENAGTHLICAENGKEGLEAFERETFDLILMDIQMPVMDGFTATRRLREQGCTIPIVALTAHAMRGDREKCLAAGCTDYLAKPIEINQLLHKVSESLDGAPEASRDGIPETSLNQAQRAAPPEMRQADSPAKPPPLVSSLATDRPEVRRIVERFVETLCEKLEAMEAACETADWDQLAKLAHWLKGTGGTIGFACFTEAAQRLEVSAKAGAQDAAADGIQELNALADRIQVPA